MSARILANACSSAETGRAGGIAVGAGAEATGGGDIGRGAVLVVADVGAGADAGVAR